MKAYVFPGQGAQFEGMGKEENDHTDQARAFFSEADEILGFKLSETMFSGSEEDLKQTRVTQPAIFVHSALRARLAEGEFRPDAVAGHSLGEFSALVAAGALSFKDGLKLVYARALAMQEACELKPGTMAAILGLDDSVVEEICASVDDVVVPANYNCPGQLVISGSVAGVNKAVEKLNEAGARRAVLLPVGGAFHSPLMQPAQDKLEAAIASTHFSKPNCPVYQNVNAQPETDPQRIRQNLIAQLTAPVRWTQTMQQLIDDGLSQMTEVGGRGNILTGLMRRMDRKISTSAI